MGKCLFCGIAAGSIPASIIYSDDDIVAFEDINPQAPTHFLVIPRKHIPTLSELTPDDHELTGKMIFEGQKLANQRGLQDGYRFVWNCNRKAGQTVFHIHLHVLGGRIMRWPPG